MSAATTRTEGGGKSTGTREPLSQGMTGFFFVNGKSGAELNQSSRHRRMIDRNAAASALRMIGLGDHSLSACVERRADSELLRCEPTKILLARCPTVPISRATIEAPAATSAGLNMVGDMFDQSLRGRGGHRLIGTRDNLPVPANELPPERGFGEIRIGSDCGLEGGTQTNS